MLPPYYQELELVILGMIFILLAAGLYKTKYAVIAYLFIMLFRPGELYEVLGQIRFELLSGIYIGTLILFRGRLKQVSWRTHDINKAMFLFIGVVYLSVPQAFDVAFSWDYAYSNFFLIFSLYIMIICLLNEIKDLKLLIYMYLIMTMWLAYMPIFNHLSGIGHLRLGPGIIHSKGITSGVAGHVGLANMMTQAIPFAYFTFINERNKIGKGFALLALIMYVYATIGSGSRGGFLGLIICAAIFFIKTKRRSLFLILLGVGIFLFTGLDEKYLNWMSTISDFGMNEGSAHSRWDGLRNGIDMAMRRPILGVGVGCYSLARGAWFGWSVWAHNHYGELIGELGILGVASWTWLIYLCFKEIKRLKKGLIKAGLERDKIYEGVLDACWAALVLRLIIGMTTHSLSVFIWYMIAALLVVMSKGIEKEGLLPEKTKLS